MLVIRLLLLLLLQCPQLASAATPQITSVSPRELPIGGGQQLTVVGTGFGNQSAGGWCRLETVGAVGPISHSVPSWGYKGPSIEVFRAVVHSATELTCTPPAVIVPGRVVLTVTIGAATGPSSPPSCTYSSRSCPPGAPDVLEYISLVDVVIGRRPYVRGEAQGSLLVTTDPSLRGQTLALSATLPGGHRWQWQLTPQNGTDTLWFPLAAVAPIVNADMTVVISSGTALHRGNITIQRRFLRAPPDGAPPLGVSVIDHTTRQILIDGEGFQGVGWYVDAYPSNVSAQLALISTQVRLGVNQIMPYAMVKMTDAEQLLFMDGCHQMGVKVLLPLQRFGQSGSGHARNWSSGYFRHWNGSAAAAAWQAQVEATVDRVRSHPALLAYYVCDDCTVVNANIQEIALEARLYNIIRSHDPYHIVAGAIQGGFPWIFSDVANSIAPSASQPRCSQTHSTDWANCNPDTQLVLDYSLMENYDRLLINLDNPMQKNRDVRRGMEHEVIANCNGLWNDGNFLDYPAVPNDLASAMWLGLVLEDMADQLTFVFEAGSEGPPATTLGGGWLQSMVPVTWGQQARALAPSFKAPFGSVPRLNITVTSSVLMHPPPSAGPGATSIRARAWGEPCESICAHLIVVNIDQQSPAQFSLQLGGLDLPARGVNATRLFTASYNVTLSASGELRDWVGAGESNVYEVGCDLPKNVSADWKACGSRRVTCKHGFTSARGTIKASPHNATCEPM